AQAALTGLQQALKELGDGKREMAGLAKKAGTALQSRVDDLMARSDAASQRLEECAGREEQEVAQLQDAVKELQLVADTIQTSAPRLSSIAELIDSALAAQLGAVDDARTDLLTNMAALTARWERRERDDHAFRAATEARFDAMSQLVERMRSTQVTTVILLTASIVLNALLMGGMIYLLRHG
ncbi:hypothetical protein, partial [Methylomagnum sp.]